MAMNVTFHHSSVPTSSKQWLQHNATAEKNTMVIKQHGALASFGHTNINSTHLSIKCNQEVLMQELRDIVLNDW